MKTKKLHKHFATLQVYDRTARNFEKKGVKSTILKLEQKFLHIFGVAQNFQLNAGGCLAQKKGGGGASTPAPPGSGPDKPANLVQTITFQDNYLLKVEWTNHRHLVISYFYGKLIMASMKLSLFTWQ